MAQKSLKKIRKGLAGILLLCLVLALGFVGYMLISHSQSLALPSPTGPYPVGRTEWDWTDPNRLDTLSDTPGGKRELPIWIWYPALGSSSAPFAPFLPLAWVNAKAADNGLGEYLERNAATIETHSMEKAPIAASQEGYPVLIFQPGMGPSIYDYTVFAENLASHGYIVVGINETDTQNILAFSDGQIIPRSENGTIPDSADPKTAEQDANRIGKVWTEDAIFVIDQLGAVNQDATSLFFHQLEMTHLGVLGHSFGGATAIAVCQVDPRCQAGANLDGTPLSDTSGEPLLKPFLFVSEGYQQPFPQGCQSNQNCPPLYAAYQRGKSQDYFVTVNGAKHFNFTDRPLRSLLPTQILLRQMGIVGTIDPGRGLTITNAYLAAFFDRYLKGVNSPLLAGTSDAYPEVQLVRSNLQ